jgi:hypothetical protein
VPDCSSAGAVPQHCSTIYCPWTGVTVPIWREAMILDATIRNWPHASPEKIQMDVVTACVKDWRDLFHIADKLKISKRISPTNWILWLCEQVLLVNPHLRSQVERYTNKKETSE